MKRDEIVSIVFVIPLVRLALQCILRMPCPSRILGRYRSLHLTVHGYILNESTTSRCTRPCTCYDTYIFSPVVPTYLALAGKNLTYLTCIPHFLRYRVMILYAKKNARGRLVVTDGYYV